ncbi:MAG TPA: hypothetical protein VKU79_06105 [Thermoplasmataceae archaeon]|nr:hypothetical protein [Thermoplasmatales archaeon AK]HLH86416.1 hypothetical protein [Thermoplasmataceae archaeon]
MNLKIAVAIGLVLTMMAGAVSIADDGQGSNLQGQNTTNLGHFSFVLDSNGSVSNITYVSDEFSQLFAYSLSSTGANLTSALSNMQTDESSLVSTPNMTLAKAGDSSTLLVLTRGTTSNPNPVVKASINGTLSLAYVKSSVTVSNEEDNNLISGSTAITWYVYLISNPDFTGYFFTNGVVSLSNGNSTLTDTYGSTSGRLSMFSSAEVLVAGFVSHGSIESLLQKYEKEHEHVAQFSYNKTTGQVSGQFVNFKFDNKTGEITNYSKNLSTPFVVFTNITISGNGTIGSQEDFPSFLLNHVILRGSIFYYANKTFVYTFHNNPAMNFALVVDNGTLNLTLAPYLNVTMFKGTNVQNTSINSTLISTNSSVQSSDVLDTEHETSAGATNLIIHGDGFRAFMSVKGNASYNTTTKTISVMSKHLGIVNFVSPPGLQGKDLKDFGSIEYAILHGKVGGEVSISNEANVPFNYTVLYNNSLNVAVTNVTAGKVVVQVSSSEHTGTHIVFFVNQSFVGSSGKLYVYFDGKSATLSTVNGTLNVTTSTSAVYAVVNVTGGYLVIISIPHFSNHTIVISDTSLTPTSTMPSNTDLYVIAGIVVVAAIAGTVLAVRRNRK